MKLLDTTPKLFTPEEAEKKAKELQNGDQDWTYKACHDPKKTGLSLIKVYDGQDGAFIGYI